LFFRGIRVPFFPLCEEFLAEKKREEEDIEMLDDSSEIDKSTTEPAPLEDEDVAVEMSESTQVVEDTSSIQIDKYAPSIQIDEIVEEVVELIEKTVEESEIIKEVVEQIEEKVVEREEEQISTIQEEEMDQQTSLAAPSSSTPSAISA
jgi:hypothetical protein